jgi:hypothetical protein
LTISNYPDVALRLSILDERFAICKLKSGHEVPDWALKAGFFSVTRTSNELSIVCPEQNVPEGSLFKGGWRALGIEGPLDFSLTSVLVSVAEPLAAADVSIFAVSTYNTDYVLIQEDRLDTAVEALRDHGHEIVKT